VAKIWNEPTRDKIPPDKIQFKLKKDKKFLKGWGYSLAGARRKRKQEILAEIKIIELLEEVNTLDDE
jgi:hypothetical protein